MQRVQKRVLRRPRRVSFPREVRALVRGINKLQPVQRDFILAHFFHHGPDSQRREVEFYLRCVLGDESR